MAPASGCMCWVRIRGQWGECEREGADLQNSFCFFFFPDFFFLTLSVFAHFAKAFGLVIILLGYEVHDTRAGFAAI